MANSNAKVQLKSLDDGYQIIVDGEESDIVGYGEVLEMETSDGRRFLATVDCQGKEIESTTEFWAYEVLPVVDVPILEEDGDDDDQDEDDQDDDDQDGDEDEQTADEEEDKSKV